MKQHFIIQKHQKRLLLFFAGWGMDENPFLSVRPLNADWMICYDYRTLTFDTTLLQAYSNITVLAWSMGVWVASQVMSRHRELPITASIAVNGTPYPIDNEKGIAPAMFDGTLQGLNEQTLRKFQRRMCGSAADYAAYQVVAPSRQIEELKDELVAIRTQYEVSTSPDIHWQKAIVGENDRIFLPKCQRLAWQGKADVVEFTPAAHYQRELFEQLIQSLPLEDSSTY